MKWQPSLPLHNFQHLPAWGGRGVSYPISILNLGLLISNQKYRLINSETMPTDSVFQIFTSLDCFKLHSSIITHHSHEMLDPLGSLDKNTPFQFTDIHFGMNSPFLTKWVLPTKSLPGFKDIAKVFCYFTLDCNLWGN